MTDKEKLVALVGKARLAMWGKRISCRLEAEYFFAEYLLAHGVTIREQGEWATDTEDIEWGNSLKKKHCTSCGKRPHFDKEKREFILSDFCPHCGAEMKKVE